MITSVMLLLSVNVFILLENLFNPQALSWARNATALFSRNHAADSQFSERQFEPGVRGMSDSLVIDP